MREMRMQQLIRLLMKFFLLISALSLHGCAGFYIPSLTAASGLLHFKVGATNPRSYTTIRPSPTLLQNATTHDNAMVPSNNAHAPSMPSVKQPAKKRIRDSASSPSVSFYKHHHHGRHKFSHFASAPVPSNQIPTTPHSQQGHSISSFHSSFPSSKKWGSPAAAPSPIIPSSQSEMPTHPPTISPLSYVLKRNKTPPPSPVLALPPPPPNEDCTSVACTEPLTYTPPGSPCGCVWPIEVRLRLSVALYTFFPLVSELAKEIAASVSLNRSQVRIMGANAASQQLEKTIIIINLVPLKEKFNATTAFFIYQKFWKRHVFIETSLFGAYEVVYVHYPGLPPSPPSKPSSAATIDDQPYPHHPNDGMTVKPLGVDVPRRRKDGIGGGMIAVIVLSSITAFVVCMGVIWLLLSKCGVCLHQPGHTPHVLVASHGKPSGAAGALMLGCQASSASMSFGSSLMAYTGTAKIFSLTDIERATDYFNASRILGEGGFGLVYSGILDDGRKVAFKVLKRDDHHGSREFLAEVEMLSRLHHRNLVKLIGICTEDHCRCLVYELVPNGSVESHLHGRFKSNESCAL
ncbi:unnamed protein product [Ilex paraguariensis]|uniref:Protein kinase domain-containing protein n=1 Tax=Ilex paraguariensis TaxID=185542 RepID=A0ABC8TZG8_9AQUA